MNSDDLKTRAQALRTAGNSPKQIARALGIPRSQAVSLLHSSPSPRPQRPPRTSIPDKRLIGCWISRQWSNGLTITDRPADWIDDTDLPPLAMGAGLPSICVAREHNDTEAAVCGYLVDTYCQGVKNAAALGFDPHRDFYLAKPHLGTWQPPSRIQFGLHGRPYFQQGPYDNPSRIIRTLDRSVGPGNYGFTTNITTGDLR